MAAPSWKPDVGGGPWKRYRVLYSDTRTGMSRARTFSCDDEGEAALREFVHGLLEQGWSRDAGYRVDYTYQEIVVPDGTGPLPEGPLPR
jgi:hypothetical protein